MQCERKLMRTPSIQSMAALQINVQKKFSVLQLNASHGQVANKMINKYLPEEIFALNFHSHLNWRHFAVTSLFVFGRMKSRDSLADELRPEHRP